MQQFVYKDNYCTVNEEKNFIKTNQRQLQIIFQGIKIVLDYQDCTQKKGSSNQRNISFIYGQRNNYFQLKKVFFNSKEFSLIQKN